MTTCTIQDIAEGKFAIEFPIESATKQDLDLLKRIVKKAFPLDKDEPRGEYTYYYSYTDEVENAWSCSHETSLFPVRLQDVILTEFVESATIEEIADGSVALFTPISLSPSGLDRLRLILKLAFPEDEKHTNGKDTYHFKHEKLNRWTTSNVHNDLQLKYKKLVDIQRVIMPETTPVSPILHNDPVTRPAHYTSGRIEVIDFIEDQGCGFHIGNVIKYCARAGKKDPEKLIQDLEKAAWYLNRHIDNLKKQ